MKTIEELRDIKRTTEFKWRTQQPDTQRYGYQIQRGTEWLAGHSQKEIEEITKIFTFEFPVDVYELMRFTKGLSKPQINLKNVAKPFKQQWKLNIDYLGGDWLKDLDNLVKARAIDSLQKAINAQFNLLPIYGHRYIVIEKEKYSIYSIIGDDQIVYGRNIVEYLRKEFTI